jgi:hypothetical protein
VIGLGLRLSVAGGREAAARLIIIGSAVMLGVCLLLTSLAGINAVNTQNARYAWLLTGFGATQPSGIPGSAGTGSTSAGEAHAPGGSTADPLWWRLRPDFYHGRLIGRVDIAATGPGSPVPPGIPRLPGPGEFYASPELSRLLRSVPAAQLGDRYPGHQVGTIGSSALPSPDSLLIVIGDTTEHLAHQPGARQVTGIQTRSPSACSGPSCAVGVGINANGMILLLSAVALGLLFPVLIFIGTATRLSAARREERFAAMRLAGATPRQVSAIAAVESAVAATAGVAAGFGLFLALRPAVAAFPFTGARFFAGDLSLDSVDILLVAVGVPVAAAVVARLALHRVQISPLGVSRRVTPPAPRAWRLIPLLAGVAELTVVPAVIPRPRTGLGQMEEFLPGFLLLMVGLISAGPWLTMVGARAIARRARRPAALVAARRLADNPRAGFRAISGLVVALFVTTVTIGVITAFAANRVAPSGPLGDDVLISQFSRGPSPRGAVATVSDSVLAGLHSIEGVRGVAVIHASPVNIELPLQMGNRPGTIEADLVSCAQLAGTPALGRCPPGAQVVAVPPLFAFNFGNGSSGDATTWPAADVSLQRLNGLPVQAIAVGTDGSTAAIERARTRLEAAYPSRSDHPATLREGNANSDMTKFQQLADVMILASLVIAGCTLAVSVIAGLADRRRPFSLLRLTGAPLGMLRRVVALETVVPLLAVAIVSTGAAFVGAELFLRAQVGYTLQPPGPGYYGTVLGGLAVSLTVIGSTLPLLRRITGPETARNE